MLMCMNQTLALGVLPASRFLNGHTGWVQRLHEVQRVAPLMYHATHQCERWPRGRPSPPLTACRTPVPCTRAHAHALGSLAPARRGVWCAR